MAWTDGVDRATGDLITATIWNNHHGATGNDMQVKSHAHGGTTGEGSQSIGPLVLEDFTDAAFPAAPGVGKTRVATVAGSPRYRAGASGAVQHVGDKRYSGGSITGAVTADFDNGKDQEFTLIGNVTFTFANPIAGTWYSFLLTQDATGGRTVTWPAAVKWPGNTAPTLSGASKGDLIALYYDGTRYWGTSQTNYTL